MEISEESQTRLTWNTKKIKFIEDPFCKVKMGDYFSRPEPYVVGYSDETKKFTAATILESFKIIPKVYVDIPKDVVVTTSGMVILIQPALYHCNPENKKSQHAVMNIDDHILFGSTDMRTCTNVNKVYQQAKEWCENNKTLTWQYQRQNLENLIAQDERAVKTLHVVKPLWALAA